MAKRAFLRGGEEGMQETEEERSPAPGLTEESVATDAPGLNGSDTEGTAESDGKRPKKTEDQKAADFSRLASSRCTDALKAMGLLGHLANPSQYRWTEEQETAICDALEKKAAELRGVFQAARTPQEGKKRARQLLIRV